MSQSNLNVFCIDSILKNVYVRFEKYIFNGFSGLRANGGRRTQGDAISRSTERTRNPSIQPVFS